MSFQVGIGFLGGTVFFQVGLCTPLRTMVEYEIYCFMNFRRGFPHILGALQNGAQKFGPNYVDLKILLVV